MNLSDLRQYLLFLAPLVVIQLALMLAALVDLLRRPHVRGPKWAWALVIVLVNFIGPIVYFVAGRQDE